MMQELLKKNISNRNERNLISLILILFLFRSAMPVLKYPFIFLFGSAFIYSLVKYRQILFITLKEFVKDFWLIILSVGIFGLSFLLSDKLYLSVFKDLLNVLVLLYILLLMKLTIRSKDELLSFLHSFSILLFFISLAISIDILTRTFNIFSDAQFFQPVDVSSDSAGNKLIIDDSFDLVPVFFGIAGILFFCLEPVKGLKKAIYNISLVVFSLAIFFNGSRRGLILFLAILVLLVIFQVIPVFKKGTRINNLVSGTRYYFISILSLCIILITFTLYANFSFKEKAVKFIGSKNVYSTKQRIAFILGRYNTIFNFGRNTYDLYSKIWSSSLNPLDQNSSFDPKDPDSMWGTRTHKTIFPLTGDNVEIVPAATKGYLMDSTCNTDTWNNNAYSYTLLGKSVVTENDSIKASVYCYVSRDFNGTWAMLYSSGSTIGETRFDMGNKGRWQKLNLDMRCTPGETEIYLYFSKFEVKDFSSLRGYVIFAYPVIEIIKRKNSDQSTTTSYLEGKLNINFSDPKSRISDFASLSKQKYFNTNVLSFQYPFSMMLNSNYGKFDPIRKWISGLISEDTTYHAPRNKLVVDTISNYFVDPRLVRWNLAVEIFNKEYNWSRKLFGGGFNFLNWYGNYLLKDKTKSDYPHSPFLYILLYSGLIGLLLYFLLLYKVFNYYVRYIREYPVFFIFFLITFFFTFFSGGNPLDPPIMGFFVILPFFIHSIHKKIT